MRNDLPRQAALSYLQAYYTNDVDKALTFCDDDIDIIIYAPVAIFPHLGHRHGKAAVEASLKGALRNFLPTRHEIVSIINEDNKVAATLRVGLTNIHTGRVISLDCAHFFKIHGGRIVELRSFFDSIDVLEQVLGRDLTDDIIALTKPVTGN